MVETQVLDDLWYFVVHEFLVVLDVFSEFGLIFYELEVFPELVGVVGCILGGHVEVVMLFQVHQFFLLFWKHAFYIRFYIIDAQTILLLFLWQVLLL